MEGVGFNGSAPVLVGGKIILKSRHLLKGIITRCDNCNPKKRRKVYRHNLVGQKFGKWTVIAPAKGNCGGHSKWLARCECGTIREVSGGHLTGGRSTSCGCSRKENTTAVDIKGQKFGRWTVLEKVGKDKNNNVLWKCLCACGTIGIHTTHKLLSGGSLSCGCYKRERTHERCFKSLVGKRFGKLLVLEQVEDHIYPDGSHRTKYKCLCDCNNIVEVLSCSLVSGTSSCGCLKSTGELKISQILRENGIDFKQQKSYRDLLSDKGRRLRFDFYIPEKNYLIEYDGPYHYRSTGRIWCTENHVKKTQYHDRLKNKYCKKNSIPLIRIPYTHYNELCLEDLLLETSKFIMNK